MSENKKKPSTRLEVFRNEISRRREEMKKTLCSQIDASFETSLDGLLNHVTKFLNSVKSNEKGKYKSSSTYSDQSGSRKRSAEVQNQSGLHKRMMQSYNPSTVPSNVNHDPRVDLRFGLRVNPQTAALAVQRVAPQIATRIDPRVASQVDLRYDPRYDPRQSQRYDYNQNNQFQGPLNNYRQDLQSFNHRNPHNDPRLDPNCDPRNASRSYDPRSYRDRMISTMSMTYGSGPPGIPYNQPIPPQHDNLQYQNMNHESTQQQPMFFMPPPNNH